MFDISSGLMLANSDFKGLNDCFQPVERVYEKGETITISSSENDSIGIIKSGLVYLLTENNEEQRRIADYYQKGDYFGIHFLPNTDEKYFYLYAKTKCKVDMFKYQRLITCCENHCEKHSLLLDKIIRQTVKKKAAHIDILGQRTLRSKLIEFFKYLKDEVGSNTFKVPLPYSDLADYLAVDRSAMMRELKKLSEENIISADKRNIELI